MLSSGAGRGHRPRFKAPSRNPARPFRGVKDCAGLSLFYLRLVSTLGSPFCSSLLSTLL